MTKSGSRRLMPLLGAIGFVLAWVLGLLLHTSGPAIDASGAEIATHYASHRTSALVQAVLVHGVAAVCLVLVVLGVEYATSRGRSRPSDITFLVAGCLAAAISGVQLGFDIALSSSISATDAGAARLLFDTINRLDGAKLIALAVLAGAGFELGRRRVLPQWLQLTALPLTVALLVAAAGLLTRSVALADVAALALVLLLIWVFGAGYAASGQDHRA